MDDREGADNCVAFLNKVKAQAEDKGVTICIEYLNSKVNHKDYMFDHIAWGVDVMKRVNSPRVKILYDIYHAQIMDGDIVRNIRDHFQWIGHFHTGGNPGPARYRRDAGVELPLHRAGDRGFQLYRADFARILARAGSRPDRDAEQSHRNLRRLDNLNPSWADMRLIRPTLPRPGRLTSHEVLDARAAFARSPSGVRPHCRRPRSPSVSPPTLPCSRWSTPCS